jgi:hypothetical protein
MLKPCKKLKNGFTFHLNLKEKSTVHWVYQICQTDITEEQIISYTISVDTVENQDPVRICAFHLPAQLII